MLSYNELLKQFISFKSVSTDPSFDSEINKVVAWLKNQFIDNYFVVTVIEGYGNPLVVASYEVDSSAETCLIYGHYDVQPAEKDEGWINDPFELFEKDNRLYARGVVDNKGQVLIHIYNTFKLISENNLRYNIKFLLEGNEETGSASIDKFLEEHKELVDSDFVMISDGEITMGHPSIEVSFRGVLNSTITLKTSDKDLHSGLYGGVAPSASKELVDLLSVMVDKNGQILIPGFYEDIPEPSSIELEANKALPFDLAQYTQNTGTDATVLEPGWDFYNQLAFRPTLQITGIQTGYIGTGYRNSIPGSAQAKLNIRFHGKQNPDKLFEHLSYFVTKNAPKYVDVIVEKGDTSNGIFLDIENEYVKRAKKLLEESFNTSVLDMYCGTTLPIVADFTNILAIPQVLVPLGNEDCNMHGANENYDKEILNKSLNFSYNFFKQD